MPTNKNELWLLLQKIYDKSFPTTPLCGRGIDGQEHFYVRTRRYDDVTIKEDLLPKEFHGRKLGSTDIELLDFFLDGDIHGLLTISGARGSGKSSLLNFVSRELQGSKHSKAHCVLKIDCLNIGSSTPAKTNSEFLNLVRVRVDEFLKTKQPASYRAGSFTDLALDENEIANALSRASRTLEEDGKNIILVVDNVDQLDIFSVNFIRGFLIKCTQRTSAKSIIAMRYGTMRGLSYEPRSSAMAISSYLLPVGPPSFSSWLDNFGTRFREGAKKHAKEINELDGVGVTFGGTFYTFESLERFGSSFAELLRFEKRGDNVKGVLEAVRSEDMRRLIRLVRRILFHRDLPCAWLFLTRQERQKATRALQPVTTSINFHPITSLIQGTDTYYEESKDLPNLLFFSHGEGNSDFLVSFWMMTLLVDRDAVASASLFNSLKMLKYSGSTLNKTLKRLHESGLVSACDCEHFDTDAPPRDVFLTETGEYFLDTLFRNFDYVSLLCTKVPLPGVELLPATYSFAGVLLRLVKYSEEIYSREWSQLTELVKGEPCHEQRQIADALRLHGTFYSKLVSAVREGWERSSGIRSSKLNDVGESLSRAAYRIDTLNTRIGELLNRGRKSTVLPSPLSDKNQNVSVRCEFTSSGCRITVDTAESASLERFYVIVKIITSKKQTVVLESFLCSPSYRRFHERVSPFEDSQSKETEGYELNVDLIEISRHQKGVKPNNERWRSRRVALLSIENISGVVSITAERWGIDESYSSFPMGSSEAGTYITDSIKTKLDSVTTLAKTGKYEEMIQKMLAIGRYLGLCFLSKEGIANLKQLQEDADIVVIRTDDHSLPWEWLCAPTIGGRAYKPLIQTCRVSRWHYATRLHYAQIQTKPLPAKVYRTVGLLRKNNSKEHYIKPESCSCLTDLLSEVRVHKTDMLHIVGHFEPKKKVLSIKNHTSEGEAATVELDSMDLSSEVLPANCVIVSACEAAQSDLAQTIARASGVDVWAPVVRIWRDKHARALDEAFVRFIQLHPDMGAGEIIHRFRTELDGSKPESIAWLYAHYLPVRLMEKSE